MFIDLLLTYKRGNAVAKVYRVTAGKETGYIIARNLGFPDTIVSTIGYANQTPELALNVLAFGAACSDAGLCTPEERISEEVREALFAYAHRG